MSAPTVVTETGGGTTSEGTSCSCNLPSGVTSGDLLILFFCSNDSNNGTLSGWTKLFLVASGNQGLGAWYRIADGTEGSSVTVSISDNRSYSYASYRVTGYNATTPLDYATSTTTTPPTLSPSWGSAFNRWIVVGMTAQNSGGSGFTAFPTGYSDTHNYNSPHSPGNSYGQALGIANKSATAASDSPSAFTSSSAQNSVSATVAIQPVSSTAWTKTLTETVTDTDSIFKTAARALAEAVTDTDTFASLRVKAGSFAEAVTDTDTLRKIPAKLLAEAQATADTLLRSVTAVLSEIVTDTDSLVRTNARSLAEAFSNGDVLSKMTGRTLVESGVSQSQGPQGGGTAANDATITGSTWNNPTYALVDDGNSAYFATGGP